MYFTENEKAAILRLTFQMAKMDGRIAGEEAAMQLLIMNNLGCTDALVKKSDELTDGVAMLIIAGCSDEKKRVVCGLLGAMMSVDRDIDDHEMFMWTLVSSACGMPTMSVADAIKAAQEYLSK